MAAMEENPKAATAAATDMVDGLELLNDMDRFPQDFPYVLDLFGSSFPLGRDISRAQRQEGRLEYPSDD